MNNLHEEQKLESQTMIKVGILGFGKAGRSVASEILSCNGFHLDWVIRKSQQDCSKYASRLLGFEFDAGAIYATESLSADFFLVNPVDIIIDFSDTKGVYVYQSAARQGTRVISAVSKYEAEDLAVLQELSHYTSVLHSPNITLGINVLLVTAKILQGIAPHADIEIVEEHFKNKPEVSGTAKKIAEVLDINAENIRSIRAGGIIGRHEIIFGMPYQTIRLVHESISRSAFGQGAIFAATAIKDMPNGLYTMENIITDMFKNNLPVY